MDSTAPATKQTMLLTHLLVCVFAMSSWLAVSGLWVEVPVFLYTLPEGVALPSYLVLMIQCSNVGPVCYGVCKKWLVPDRLRKSLMFECISVAVLLTVGLVSCVLLSLFWDTVSVVNGTPHSVWLLILTAAMAVVDCTSSVIFLPFMARFPSQFVTSFYLGEGLSGLVPGIAGIIQGHGDPVGNITSSDLHSSGDVVANRISGLTFSLESFFIFLAVIVCLSAVSFVCINTIPACKQLQQTPYDSLLCEEDDVGKERVITRQCDSVPAPINSRQLVFLLCITFWISCLGNGFLPSLQAFACIPYGPRAYSLAVKLSVLVNPLAPLLGMRFRCRSRHVVSLLTSVVSCLAAYVVIVAAKSPSPPWASTYTGALLIVGSYIAISGISSFIKVSVASSLSEIGGYKALFWCGAMTQLGSFCGAVTSYCLINVAGVFHS